VILAHGLAVQYGAPRSALAKQRTAYAQSVIKRAKKRA
jgi:hypothetical protein